MHSSNNWRRGGDIWIGYDRECEGTELGKGDGEESWGEGRETEE